MLRGKARRVHTICQLAPDKRHHLHSCLSSSCSGAPRAAISQDKRQPRPQGGCHQICHDVQVCADSEWKVPVIICRLIGQGIVPPPPHVTLIASPDPNYPKVPVASRHVHRPLPTPDLAARLRVQRGALLRGSCDRANAAAQGQGAAQVHVCGPWSSAAGERGRTGLGEVGLAGNQG